MSQQGAGAAKMTAEMELMKVERDNAQRDRTALMERVEQLERMVQDALAPTKTPRAAK